MRRNKCSRQQLNSFSKSTTGFYLPDDCWEYVFEFIMVNHSYNNSLRNLKSLSLVSKQFLSITNGFRFSLTILDKTRPFLHRLFKRFTNLTSLDLTYFKGDLDALLSQIACFRLNLTSLIIHDKLVIPANGLRAFSRKITTLTSLTCSYIKSLHNSDIFLVNNCFPNLKLLDFTGSYDISEEGVVHVLSRCCNIRHLNLAYCFNLKVKLPGMNFEIPKLEVLNLSSTKVDDEALYVISKSCCGLLELLLGGCKYVTEKGLMHVVENCTQLREIDLRFCYNVHANVVASMVSSRPSLRKIFYNDFNDGKMGLFPRCIVC